MPVHVRIRSSPVGISEQRNERLRRGHNNTHEYFDSWDCGGELVYNWDTKICPLPFLMVSEWNMALVMGPSDSKKHEQVWQKERWWRDVSWSWLLQIQGPKLPSLYQKEVDVISESTSADIEKVETVNLLFSLLFIKSWIFPIHHPNVNCCHTICFVHEWVKTLFIQSLCSYFPDGFLN